MDKYPKYFYNPKTSYLAKLKNPKGKLFIKMETGSWERVENGYSFAQYMVNEKFWKEVEESEVAFLI